MKTFSISCLLLAATPLFAGVGEPASISTNRIALTFDLLSELAEEMRTNHPALKAAIARTNSAAAAVDAVRTWEDPMATIGGMAARRMMRADDGDLIYGVEQKLPMFGKPKLARQVAASELDREVATAEFELQRLRSDLAKTAFKTALAGQTIVVGEQDLAWLDAISVALQSRYRSGQAGLMEVLALENERSRRLTQLEIDRAQWTHAQVALNRFLNRDLASSWPILDLPPVAGQVHFNQRLVEFALKYEPRIQVMTSELRSAEAMVALTKRERLPDVSVGLEGRNYSGNGSFRQGMFVLSMNLPWGNAGKYRSAIRRDQAKVKAAELDLENYQFELREEVHLLTVKIDAARREALLYRDQILPRTESALDSARAAWESNQLTFRELLDARRMVLEGRLMYARAVAEQYEMMSELVLCCGLGDLNALTMIGAEPDSPSTSTH